MVLDSFVADFAWRTCIAALLERPREPTTTGPKDDVDADLEEVLSPPWPGCRDSPHTATLLTNLSQVSVKRPRPVKRLSFRRSFFVVGPSHHPRLCQIL
jgi:hypothetical protein